MIPEVRLLDSERLRNARENVGIEDVLGIVREGVLDDLELFFGDGLPLEVFLRGVGFEFERLRLGFGDGDLRLRLALCAKDLRLLLTFRLKDLGLLVTFGFGYESLAVPFRFENLGALFAFGLHLLGHGVLDVARRFELLDFDAEDLDSPLHGFAVKRFEKARVDGIAVGESVVERHGTENVAEVGLREVDDREEDVGDFVLRLLGVGDLDVDDSVDGHADVVLGNDLLLRDGDDLFADVDLAHGLDSRNEERQAGAHLLGKLPEIFDESDFALAHLLQEERNEDGDDDYERYESVHVGIVMDNLPMLDEFNGSANNPPALRPLWPLLPADKWL